jgi:hypothetical protein
MKNVLATSVFASLLFLTSCAPLMTPPRRNVYRAPAEPDCIAQAGRTNQTLDVTFNFTHSDSSPGSMLYRHDSNWYSSTLLEAMNQEGKLYGLTFNEFGSGLEGAFPGGSPNLILNVSSYGDAYSSKTFFLTARGFGLNGQLFGFSGHATGVGQLNDMGTKVGWFIGGGWHCQ